MRRKKRCGKAVIKHCLPAALAVWTVLAAVPCTTEAMSRKPLMTEAEYGEPPKKNKSVASPQERIHNKLRDPRRVERMMRECMKEKGVKIPPGLLPPEQENEEMGPEEKRMREKMERIENAQEILKRIIRKLRGMQKAR